MKSREYSENNTSRHMSPRRLKHPAAASSWPARLLALSFAAVTLLGWSTAHAETVEVEAGNQRTINFEKPTERVAVGNDQVAKVKLINQQELLLQGIDPGTTSLLVWQKGKAAPLNYTIRVRKAAETLLLNEFPELRLKASSELVALGGNSTDMMKHEEARHIAQKAGGGGKDSMIDVARLPYNGEVQVEVRVIELSRRVLKRAGLNLISNTSGFTFGAFAPGSLTKTELKDGVISGEFVDPISQALNLVMGSGSEGVLGILSMLEGNGFARTLAQPVLVAQSGQTATFLAGGEFPVPVPQGLGQTSIQYKPYGIRLEVSPTVLAENRIAIKIAPEVSDLNFENAITINGVSVPSLLTRRANTSVEMGNGESFVIGGLISQSVAKNLDKVPGLGDIPILGMFFKSARLSREEKEVLIIVTPRLVRPMAANTQLGPLPGAELADYNPSLWEMMMLSDREEAARFNGLSK